MSGHAEERPWPTTNNAGAAPIITVEYIGFDEDTQTLRSHAMDNRGTNFAYTWEIDGGYEATMNRIHD